jgi:hypothetical protein
MMGDYTRRRVIYQDASTTADFAATDGNTTLIAGKTGRTIYVQRIIVTIKTSAAQAITFEDSASTPIYVAKVTANPGADTRWDFDFGPEGKALTSAKNLAMDMTAGNAGHVEVLAYFKPDPVVAA